MLFFIIVGAVLAFVFATQSGVLCCCMGREHELQSCVHEMQVKGDGILKISVWSDTLIVTLGMPGL